jgi:hypothetical protein
MFRGLPGSPEAQEGSGTCKVFMQSGVFPRAKPRCLGEVYLRSTEPFSFQVLLFMQFVQYAVPQFAEFAIQEMRTPEERQ